ncbi:hypothetical protein QAD02_015402 [Eretmocerus hayati]|uniref:Uncharacterized protein n=1 Tax=Eretmocerus hayati TaxID=131215 RepID=A0ACC2P7P4_9HYME|nr:hypothetical protein QAD02_015402 [Eretmocerus hayati]
MDCYELSEPTDMGNETIDYDPLDNLDNQDNQKRSRWDKEEVLDMLKMIKEHSLVSQYSVMKMSLVLSKLLMKKGWNRTYNQIHSKMLILRKNYLACEKQRIATGRVKECSYYNELRDIYKDIDNGNAAGLIDCDLDNSEQCNMMFPNDPVKWSKAEIQKMLNLVKSMKLKNELTLTFFSPTAVRLIGEAMRNAGYDRSTDQVRSALTSLRAMYIDYKIGFDNNENPQECMFFPHLDLFWGKEYKRCRMKDKRHKASDDPWSTDETIMLLNLVQDLNIAEETYHNSAKVAEDLSRGLAENGYSRPKQQIIDRLEDMKTDFFDADNSNNVTDATRIFPFYNMYKRLFGLQFNCNTDDQLPSFTLDPTKLSNNIPKGGKPREIRDSPWKDSEVRLLLKTVRDLTSKLKSNDFLEDEKLRRIVKTLYVAGYSKSAEQIKLKLSSLKSTYLKCNLDDSSDKDVFLCPFYNELHEIFQTSVSDERYELIQNRLSENLNPDLSNGSDHSYTNVDCCNLPTNNGNTNKVTVVPNKPAESWCPVESIIAEEVVVASSSQDCNYVDLDPDREKNLNHKESSVSALSNNSDTRIPEISSTQADPVLNKDTTSKGVGRYEIAVEHEVITIDEDDLEQFESYPDSQARGATISGNTEGPPCKKLRVMEYGKQTSNKQVLLRPIESQAMDPSALSKPKFVRLIVDSNKSQSDQITAHIQPLKIDAATSVSSGMSSPTERPDMLRLNVENALSKENLNGLKLPNGVLSLADGQSTMNYLEKRLSETIQEAVQSIKKHNESMQEKHQAWIEKQFEIQRKHNEEQKRDILNQLQELRNDVASLMSSQQLLKNNQNLEIEMSQ